MRFRAGFVFRQRAALDNAPVFGFTISYRIDSSGREWRDERKIKGDEEQEN
jgi:hypothetical protein